MKDTYKTIESNSEEVLFKDKNSKFFGYAFPITSEDEIKLNIENLKKQHHSARHWCYAWQIGTEFITYRANDDGEPNNSAGMPIYGQIQSFDVTNVLVVVVRYFGGVKLGVSGLINAYRTGAKMALEESKIIERTIDHYYLLKFNYNKLNIVMRMIKENQLPIVSQEMELTCSIKISVRKKDSERIFELFNSIFEVDITSLND
ncbi:YigZ family protein [Winogradskyella sp. 3972H.M.0a.05]|uniref:IMPACT family protein n=1 Tax=Winogradskyella sp. 3972H.M.0a.05 TaxID=2950277 RepID=UPI0033907941